MLLIFDWDGTLVDSAPKIVRCLRLASAEAGVPILTDDQYRHIIGLGLPEAIESLYPQESVEVREQIRLGYSDIFVADAEPTTFFDGVLDGLQQLKDQGFTLAVATGKSRRGMQRVLDEKNLHHLFHATRCADETASKPDPKMLNEIIEQLQCKVAAAVMVGDTSFDLEMAHNAQIPSIGVRYGAHSEEHLLPHEPVALVDDFFEVMSLVRQRFGLA